MIGDFLVSECDPSVSESDPVLLSDLISSDELALSNVTFILAFCWPTPPAMMFLVDDN